MIRSIVTGGAGFIGSHLVDRLVESGREVVVLDDFSTGSEKNLEVVREKAGGRLRVVFQDVRTPWTIPCDEIYHLACPASPAYYQRDGVRTIETAFLGTRNALACARENRAKLVIASTSEVYGDPVEHPQTEGYAGNVNPTHRRSSYKEGKRAAETLALAYSEQFTVDVRIARIFNTYGPRMAPDDGRVVSSFVVAALAGKPLLVYGGGSQTRSFCYVSDTVDALERLMSARVRSWLSRRESVFNVGNPDERTILSVAEDVIREVGAGRIKSREMGEEDAAGSDPKRRCPSIALAERVLGWKPEVEFLDGLRRTIACFRGRV